ncbi:FliH/SctL family protein [Buchnera aphidicola]|uniref:Flagellar assembly protein FliH n=1 Tax=Buchnera aphidicola (Cinara strobi) TaxID=1921549 RepID=A0A3B1DVI4_9GAMM|nr:FliH/SctL family protein [Buchnera aphidicola]VAX76263.1 Flagellar assembly protein FliH [Buchnera aphidicola (Cinara strobi)]
MKKFIKNDLWKKWNPRKLDKSFHLVNFLDGKKYKKILSEPFSKEKKFDKLKYSHIYKKGYNQGWLDGYKKGYYSGWFQGRVAGNNLFLETFSRCIQIQCANLLKKFQIAIYHFNDGFSKRLMRIVLRLSKILVDDIFIINKNYIKEKIKQLTQKSHLMFKKLQLHVHPEDYDIVKKKFGTLMNMYGWIIVLNEKIDTNSYKIITQEGELDASMSSFWNRVNNAANLSD